MGLLKVGGCKLNSVIREVWLVEFHRLLYKVISNRDWSSRVFCRHILFCDFQHRISLYNLTSSSPAFRAGLLLKIMPASSGTAGKPDKSNMSSRLLTMKVCIITFRVMDIANVHTVHATRCSNCCFEGSTVSGIG